VLSKHKYEQAQD
jgi:hypothetical protein